MARNLQNLRPWRPGQSGNPGGRPKGALDLSLRIRRRAKDGKQLLDWLFEIASGQPVTIDDKRIAPTLGDRLKAMDMLLDRGWGKPMPQILEGEADGPMEIRIVYVDAPGLGGAKGG